MPLTMSNLEKTYLWLVAQTKWNESFTSILTILINVQSLQIATPTDIVWLHCVWDKDYLIIKDKWLQSIFQGYLLIYRTECYQNNLPLPKLQRITFQRQKARTALIKAKKKFLNSLYSLAAHHPNFDYLNTLRHLNAFSDLITTKFTKKTNKKGKPSWKWKEEWKEGISKEEQEAREVSVAFKIRVFPALFFT